MLSIVLSLFSVNSLLCKEHASGAVHSTTESALDVHVSAVFAEIKVNCAITTRVDGAILI